MLCELLWGAAASHKSWIPQCVYLQGKGQILTPKCDCEISRVKVENNNVAEGFTSYVTVMFSRRELGRCWDTNTSSQLNSGVAGLFIPVK